MIFNHDDYTVTVPLVTNGTGEPREVVVPGPSMVQLAALNEIIAKADQAAGSLPPLNAAASPEERAAYETALAERSALVTSEKSPYAAALIEIVKLLTGTELTIADLPGWAGVARTVSGIIGFFRVPWPGAPIRE